MEDTLDYSLAVQVSNHAPENNHKQELTNEQLEDKRSNRIIAACIFVMIVGASLVNIFIPI